MELLNQLIMAVDLQFLDSQIYTQLRPEIEELSNKLNALKTAYFNT